MGRAHKTLFSEFTPFKRMPINWNQIRKWCLKLVQYLSRVRRRCRHHRRRRRRRCGCYGCCRFTLSIIPFQCLCTEYGVLGTSECVEVLFSLAFHSVGAAVTATATATATAAVFWGGLRIVNEIWPLHCQLALIVAFVWMNWWRFSQCNTRDTPILGTLAKILLNKPPITWPKWLKISEDTHLTLHMSQTIYSI